MGADRQVSRRGFLKTSGLAVGGGAVLGAPSEAAADRDDAPRAQDLAIRERRTLGRTGFEVSDISFGTGNLNNPNVLAVALDMGINYIDTAEHYVNGQAERTVGEVLEERDRSSIFLTTKLNLNFAPASKEAIIDRLHRCLERMRTEYVDCLMIHMTPRAGDVRHEGFHQAAEELKAQGKVRFLGLSNHGIQHSVYGRVEDTMESVVGAAVEDGRFDVALFVYNFLQKEQGERIIEACRSKNVGVTLMKTDPVGIGSILGESMEEARRAGRRVSEARERVVRDYQTWLESAEEFKTRHGLRSATQVRDAAIRFALDHSGVHTVCPTINTFDALEAFVSLSGQKLSDADRPMLASYDEILGRYYCRHACGICESACPQRVPVNTIMRYAHYFHAQRREKQAIEKYASLPGPKADRCMGCDGPCESACPFGVPARSLLARVHQHLTLA
jgi:predicted aldo/keto reductase-like oxidoreductase